MLFEKLLELLAALAVAAGGIAGIGNAAHHADPRADEAALTRAAAHVDDSAAIRIATVMSHTAALLAELEAVGPTDGLARAAEAAGWRAPPRRSHKQPRTPPTRPMRDSRPRWMR